jgi:hypothetical protein
LLPRDDDGDGRVDEDGYDDLNNDGHIVQMRKKDPNGQYVIDPENPRMMKKTDKDRPGQYTMLGWEGFDNDNDGKINEDGPGYYDPNRNWAWNWQPDWIQGGSDQYPFSIPENRQVAEFVIAHRNIAGAQSYHNAGGMVLRGPGVAEDKDVYKPKDVRVYDYLGELGEEILPRYRYLTIYKDMYSVYGGELDWFYGARGIFTFTNELWTAKNMFNDKESEGWFGRTRDIYRFDELLLFGEGIVDWQPVIHPQYGKIEIGGIKKSWTRTAPSFLLEEMCHRNMAFTLFHAHHLPVVSIDSLMIEKISDKLYKIDIIIKNNRVIPTRSQQDVMNDIVPADVVKISGNNINVRAGFRVLNPYLGKLKEQDYIPDEIRIPQVDGMGTERVRWIISGRGEIKIIFSSVKGGKASLDTKL